MRSIKNIYDNDQSIFYDEFNGEIIIRDENFTVKNLTPKEISEEQKEISED